MSKRIAIIGGGLAGTACAYILKQRGYDPVLYEAADTLAAGASGNVLGLYNPRLSVDLKPHGWYYKAAFELALSTFEALPAIDWNPCGALHLITNEQKHIRYHKMVKSWGWPSAYMHLVSAPEASEIANISLTHDALFLPKSGYVSPHKLCHAYAKDIDIKLNTIITDLDDLSADIVILACGMGVLNFAVAQDLPLRPVAGQVTITAATRASAQLKTALCYGGYCTPTYDGQNHMIGATFHRHVTNTAIRAEDDQDNIEKLNAVCPDLGLKNIIGHNTGIRTTSRHHTPVVKQLDKRTYISTAHGSHGILSTLSAAHMIADHIEHGLEIKEI